MKTKRLSYGMLCILLLACSVSRGTELYVCKDGCDWDTIEDALLAAIDDDTIVITDQEVYPENELYITQNNLTIKSPDPNYPPTVEATFYVTGNGFTLNGMNIGSESMRQFGVYLEKATSGHVIKNCDFGIQSENNFPHPYGGIAIFSDFAPYTAENNNIHNWIIGVLSRGVNNTISNNKVYDAFAGVLSIGNSCTLSGNEISDAIHGAVWVGSDNSVSGNSIHDNYNGLWLRGSNISVTQNRIYSNTDNKNHDPNSMSGGIIWRYCEDMTIQNNEIHNNENGIVGYYGIGTYTPDNTEESHNSANYNNIYDNADYDVYYDPNDPPEDEGQTQEWFDATNNYWGDDQAYTVSLYVDTRNAHENPIQIDNNFSMPELLMPICGPEVLPADLSGPDDVPDCRVDVYDLVIFAQGWLVSTEPPDDLTGITDWYQGL